MKPQELENVRYKKSDHCKIMLEEKIMFSFLNDWTRDSKKRASETKILDLGCGSGLISKEVQKLGYQVKGLDFSEEAVKKAISNGINAEICNLDEEIKGNDEEFDVIWAGDIIEHVFDPIGLLREANRVLKKDGIIIASIPSDVGIVTRLKILFGISYQEITYKKYGYHKHHTFFTLDLMRYMLEKNGFNISRYGKILNTGKKRISHQFLPSFLYNQLVLQINKK